MSHRKIVLVACAAALALAGCGGSVQGDPASAPANNEPAAPAAESTPAPPTKAKPDGGGKQLTPTGTTLKVGQTATVLYETKSLAKETTRLAITTKSVKKGSINDMKDFNLDAQTKASEPFYVTVTFKNVGPKPMEPGGIFGLINAHNTGGDKLGSLSLLGEFKQCDGLPPKTLGVGKSYTQCDIYIAPKGQDVAKVVFGHYVELEETEITWTVG